MKAKDLAARYAADPTPEHAGRILRELVLETKELYLKRGGKSEAALVAVIKEVDLKWRAFAKLRPEYRPDLFKTFLHAAVPLSKELFP